MKKLGREKETFTSDFLQKFSELAELLEKKCKVVIQLAQVLGKRWSYLSGITCKQEDMSPPERIKIHNNLGVIIYNWSTLSMEERRDILETVKKFIHAWGVDKKLGK